MERQSFSSSGRRSDSFPITIPAVTVTCADVTIDDEFCFGGSNNRDSADCDVFVPNDFYSETCRPLLQDITLINRGISAPADMPSSRSAMSPTSDGAERTSSATGRQRSPSAVEMALCGGREVKRRLVYKTGECNVSSTNVQQRKRRFIVDIFTTMLELKWRYNALVFILAFVTTWTFFGLLWLGVARLHGDHEVIGKDDSWKPCVEHVTDFTSAILFSIETQHTIGYGLRVPNNKCPEVKKSETNGP